MSIAFRSATNTSSLTGTEPAGATSGDVIIACVNATVAPTGPAGWTQIGVTRHATVYYGNLWYIIRTGSAPSYVWGGGGTPFNNSIVCWSGVTSIGASASSADGSTVSPTVTSVAPNSMMVAAYSDEGSNSFTYPSGMTQRSLTTCNGIAELALPSPGATGTKTWGPTNIGGPAGAWSIVLEGDPAVPASLTLSAIAATAAVTNTLSTKATIVPSAIAAQSAVTNSIITPAVLAPSQITALSSVSLALLAPAVSGHGPGGRSRVSTVGPSGRMRVTI